MFKVHENGDGSTDIFCSKTGKLICTIRSQHRNMGVGGRPVEPSPKPRPCCFNLGDSISSDEETVKPDPKKDRYDSPLWNEPNEEFTNDCISAPDYARCLNLVPSNKFKKEPIDQLKTSFPLRNISKIKPLNTGAAHDKLPDELPVTTSLGLKLLNHNRQKNYYCDQTVQQKVKNCDSFCRLQINSDYTLGHFPKLRFREKKDYPVLFSSTKVSKYLPAHTYAFNKRQRLENLVTIKTGINAGSRKLLLEKCSKRLAVSIKRMPNAEIEYSMQKRAKYGPIEDLIRGEEPSTSGSDSVNSVIRQNNPLYIDISCSDDESSESKDSASYKDDPSYKCKVRKEINFEGVLSNCKEIIPSSVRNRNGQFSKRLPNTPVGIRDCSVELKDIFYNIVKHNKDFYVARTNIRVPFMQEYINCLDSKRRKDLVIQDAKDAANLRYDHAYHRPFSQSASKRKLLPNSPCLNYHNPKIKNDFRNNLKVSNGVKNKSNSSAKLNVKRSNSLKPTVNKTHSDLKVIPVIDLTDSPKKEDSGGSSLWEFHCYGCGHRSSCHKESEAYSIGSKHMKNFHCVSDPQSFLNISNSSSGFVLEAFPGYKSG